MKTTPIILKIVVWHFEFEKVGPLDKDIFTYEDQSIEYLTAHFEDCICLCPRVNNRDSVVAFCKYAYDKNKEADISEYYIYQHSDYSEFSQFGATVIEHSVKDYLPVDLRSRCFVVLFGKSDNDNSTIYSDLINPIRQAFDII